MSATKRLSAISMQDKLDKLAADVSMPIPDMGLARLLSGIFNVLGLGFIVLGGVALYFGLQPAPTEPNPGGVISDLGQSFGGSSRTALMLASILGIVGGASYMLLGATVNMIADIRIETAYNRRLLAALLESNLRPPIPPNVKAPIQPYHPPDQPTLSTVSDLEPIPPTSDTGPQPVIPSP